MFCKKNLILKTSLTLKFGFKKLNFEWIEWIRTGVLKLFWLATQKNTFSKTHNPQNVCHPLDVKNLHLNLFFWIVGTKKHSFLKFQIWRPLFSNLATHKRIVTPILRTVELALDILRKKCLSIWHLVMNKWYTLIEWATIVKKPFSDFTYIYLHFSTGGSRYSRF